MDASDKPIFEIAGSLKSWIPWRSEPAGNVSRDFWMPDQSCRVCYECDSQFTWIIRKHHCRFCGRVFCAKCTSNWVPTPPTGESNTSNSTNSKEEWEKIRVCNYCFKEWEQGVATALDNEVQVTGLDLSSSPSAASFISSKSSITVDSSTSITLALMETTLNRQGLVISGSSDNVMNIGVQSPEEFGFFTNRSDDEDDAYGVYQLDPATMQFSQVNEYYGQVHFDEIDNEYGSLNIPPYEESMEARCMSSSVLNNYNANASKSVQEAVKKEVERDNTDECETTSSVYATQNVNLEPVDFENNGVLWVPPDPEDQEDEREALMFDVDDNDDDEGDACGEWGYLRCSSSFGSGENRNRDKSNEEHKRAMKIVVDGHFRALMSQLLQVENLLSAGDVEDADNWLEIITSLSWEAASLLKPDTSKGGGMDPGGYVKIKCLASGQRGQSMVVKGVVCKKNVAHRRMTSKIEKPRLLILGGALEYHRVSNLLSSVDTLLQQEMDHLKMAVAKIDSHNPDILLVEKSVSRYAQEYLLAKDISLVLNMKRPLLERIARCTGSRIVPSIDHLSSPKLGHCDMFHVEKFLEEHGSIGSGGKKLVKTLMYFENCPKPLGCTILLRGANGDELKKVKHVVQYGVFAAYHLAVETSFLADEGATLPEFPLNSPLTVALPDAIVDRSISTIPGFSLPTATKETSTPQSRGGRTKSNNITAPDLQNTMVPSTNLRCASTMGKKEAKTCALVANNGEDAKTTSIFSNGKMGKDDIPNDCGKTGSALQVDGKKATEEAESSKEEFPPSPSDHQSILVSLSSRCVWKGTVCERSHLFRIKYYGNFDKPLGRFLRDHLFDPSYRCSSCQMPSEAHVQCYTHRQGTLTISVKKLPEHLLAGEKEGKIWMWHRCLKCPRGANGFPPSTRRIVMSDAAWGLSFGKFLELSFSNHAAASRVASCGHSLHRDCLRFYGFGQMVACFRYASIDVHSVYLPPAKLDFNYENQEWIQKELQEVVSRADLLFSEVLRALDQMVQKIPSSKKASKSRHQTTDLEGMLQNEKAEFEESVRKMTNKETKPGQPVTDILEINRLRRQLFFQSYMWDHRLVYVVGLENNLQEDVNNSNTNIDDEKTPQPSNEKLSFQASKSLSNAKISGTQNQEGSNIDTPKRLEVKVKKENNQSISTETCADSRPSRSRTTVRRSLSDGQFPSLASLSETLDAAWTGENHPVKKIGTTEGNNGGSAVAFKESVVTPVSRSNENLDLVDRTPRVSTTTRTPCISTTTRTPRVSTTTTKGFDSLEDSSMSWLGMPFINFYRSLNKNFLRGDEKLDSLSEYNPVYISSFREAELQGGARLLLPVGVNDTIVPVYDDEPTSIISYALVSQDYLCQVDVNSSTSSLSTDFGSFQSADEMALESFRSLGSTDESILSLSTSRGPSLVLDPLSYTKALHARVSFGDEGPLGKVTYTVTCYYAKQFESLRSSCCPSQVNFVRSLSRCKKWGAQGGKSNVFFAKTLDDRFIVKQVTKTELESFIKVAHSYFKYLSESIGMGSPTCLAKILGIYQVTSKHFKGGKESKMDVLVMENLLFKRNVNRLYDLKGSSRSRYNPDSSGSNKVLLDQNLIEAMPTSPIFVGNKAKRLLERAVWNDTAFLASIDVMDYSLLVGVDEEKHELVLGIIDFMRQYTWDKHLETWVKASGILGGPKNASPTVISPKQYKKRFRKAMTAYFLMVPDQWSPPSIIQSKSQTDLCSSEGSPTTTTTSTTTIGAATNTKTSAT